MAQESPQQSVPNRDDWDDHWASFGKPALQNPANDYRNRLILGLLSAPEPGAVILDIGSGQGQLALIMQRMFPQSRVIGIEYSAEGVKRSSHAAEESGLGARFVQRDLLQPPKHDNSPSLIPKGTLAVCSEVLEHVDRPDALLRNASEYMANGCTVVITVPGGPMSALDRHIGHRRHYGPRSLRDLLEASGYEVETVFRAGFPFFNLYRLAVIARGQKLIDDLGDASGDRSVSKLQRWMAQFFGAAFRLNLTRSPLGWQIVAVARPCNA